MLFDMPTLLAMRVGIDGLTALAFFGLLRRYPTIGGPGWWSLSSAVSILGSLGLWVRDSVPDFLAYGMGNTALCVAPLLAWMGLRSHLQFLQPMARVAAAGLVLAGLQSVFIFVWDLSQARQGVFALTVLIIMAMAYRDMTSADPQRRVPEMQALKLLTVVSSSPCCCLPWPGRWRGCPCRRWVRSRCSSSCSRACCAWCSMARW